MATTAVKICDVKTTEVAHACASAGVDLVGIHCIWNPPSASRRRELNGILEALQGRCQTVLVTRQTDLDIVRVMVEAHNWDYIQLHASWNREAVLSLREILSRLGQTAKLIGVVGASDSTPCAIANLEEVVDALLIDSSLRGGTGVLAGRDRLRELISRIERRPFLIAGGLRPENVVGVIREFRPWGVDVQSGVERPDGSRVKDLALIGEFVQNVKMLRLGGA